MLPGKQYSPADYLAMALRWKWVIVVPFLVGTYVALVISSRQPEIYQSEMLIRVIPQQIPPAFVQSTVTMRTIDRLSALTEQILSRTELERLITGLDLYQEERARLPMQDVVERMRLQYVKIEPVYNREARDADSFYVRFKSHDPVTAKRVTERLGALFIDVNSRDRNNLAIQTQQFLVSQLDESKKKLEETEQRMRAFRERYAGRLPTQLAVNMQASQNAQMRASQLAESIARDRVQRTSYALLLEAAENELVLVSAPTSTPAQATTNAAGPVPVLGTTAQQLAQARQALAGLELRLTAEHPDMTRTKSFIAKLEAQLEAETKAAEEARLAAEAAVKGAEPLPVTVDPREVTRRARIKQLTTDIETLDRDIARKEEEEMRQRAVVEDLQKRMDQVPGLESEWVALTRDYETQAASYRVLLSKSETAQLAANLEERQIGEQFQVLDPARVPVTPLTVNRVEINGMGAMIGLGVGVMLAGLLELRDRTFHHADDIIDVLKLPVVALVPQVIADADRRRARLKKLAAAAAATVLVLIGAFGFYTMKLWNYVV
jgi:polysaccharide chain length determinant protein (PEP-CTERM system associated)